jgi:hypothetical protein
MACHSFLFASVRINDDISVFIPQTYHKGGIMHHYKHIKLVQKDIHSLERALGRIEGKMEAIQESLLHLQTHMRITDKRLRKLESLADKWKGYGSFALGASTLFGAVMNVIITWLFK